MVRKIAYVLIGVIVGGSVPTVAAWASTPKPSGYCTKKEVGQVKSYTTPSGSATYKVKCVKTTTQKWKRA